MIDTIGDRNDDNTFPAMRRGLYILSPSLALLSLAAYYVYFGFRIMCTLATQTARSETIAWAWLIIFAEAVIAGKYLISASQGNTNFDRSSQSLPADLHAHGTAKAQTSETSHQRPFCTYN
jgi:hypothetical protein